MYKGSFTPLSERYPNITDFSAEKILYGRVNRVFTPIVIPQNSKRLKRIQSKSVSSSDIKALNFVVDAFTDLQRQFDKCLNTNKIATDDPYLSSLKVYKGYIDPYDYYGKYLLNFTELLVDLPIFDKNKIVDFDYVTESLHQIISINGKNSPFTFPAFIKNKKTPINISGLVIEIADLGSDNDNEKVNRFVNSRNWEFYVNTCKSYGFMIDENVPWRLVADIGSSVMLSYAKRYNLNSTNEIILNCYQNAHEYYYNNFLDNLLNLYNTLKPNIIIEAHNCNDGTQTKTKKPESYEINKLRDMLGSNIIIDMYCNIRFLEEEVTYTEEERESIIRDTIQISNVRNDIFAITQFENLINKTFDYQGSLGYYIRQERARQDIIT